MGEPSRFALGASDRPAMFYRASASSEFRRGQPDAPAQPVRADRVAKASTVRSAVPYVGRVGDARRHCRREFASGSAHHGVGDVADRRGARTAEDRSRSERQPSTGGQQLGGGRKPTARRATEDESGTTFDGAAVFDCFGPPHSRCQVRRRFPRFHDAKRTAMARRGLARAGLPPQSRGQEWNGQVLARFDERGRGAFKHACASVDARWR